MMKKFVSMMLLLTASLFVFTACSDDDDAIQLTSDAVVGTWDVTWAKDDTGATEVPQGYIYITLKADGSYVTQFLDNRYTGDYEIKGNTVVGTTLDPITEYYKFTSLDGNNASIDYSNSEGDSYQFLVTKR